MGSIRRRTVVLLSCLAGLAGAPSDAAACSCVEPNPRCQTVWNTPDIFVGQVLAIDTAPADTVPFLPRRVRIRTAEVFRGGAGGEVDIWTGQGGGDCGYGFKAGATYLIYAYRDTETGRLATGICSRTQPLSSAAEDLEYLRSSAKSTARLGRIFGHATRDDSQLIELWTGRPKTPFAGAKVIAEGGGRTYEARTAADGAYEFAVPPGTYTVRVEVPDGLYARWSPEVTLPDARGCALNDIRVYWNGRIAGRLVTEKREPAPHFGLELLPVDRAASSYFSPSFQVRTDARGLYEFSELPPGVYYVGYNTQRDRGASPDGPRVLLAHADGTPRTVEVTPGGRVNVEDLPLPSGVKLVQVSGIVAEPGGVPSSRAQVYVRASATEFRLIGAGVVAGRDGRFTITLIADRSYFLVAEGSDETGRFVSMVEGPVFVASADITGITLTLRPNR